MAKAYQDTRALAQEAQIFCSSCDEWDDESNWTLHTAYKHDGYSRWNFYDDDHHYIFGDSCEEIEVIEHDNCSEYFTEWQTEKVATWVCGVCSRKYDSQDSARHCCT